jgi:DNA polymerase elongation subunit (family B)
MNFYTHVAQWGNQLLVRAVENGVRKNFKVKYEPTLFVPVQKETGWKTLEGKNVNPMKFLSIKEAKDFVKQYENQPWLVYGMSQFVYTYISEKYPRQIEFDSSLLKIITIDIEVECENGFPFADKAEEPMLSITVKDHSQNKIIVWGLRPYTTSREDVEYIFCETERELLARFLSWWESDHPDVVTGWNTERFDIPYIVNRIEKVMGEEAVNRLSPWGSVRGREIKSTYGKSETVYDIMGVEDLDYLLLYRKFTYSAQESYRLDHIAHVELGERKDENPYETFRAWYTEDYQSFIDYNIQDVELVDRLDDKMKLIDLIMTMTYEAKVNMTDSFTSVKYWDVLIYNHLLQKKVVIPQKRHSISKSEKYAGAYVKEPQVGQHKWVLSFDLNSLYPHLIMQYNISPETLLPDQLNFGDKGVDAIIDGKLVPKKGLDGNVTATPNGAMFRKDFQGFLPEMMQTMYDDRTIYKKKMLAAKQMYEDTKDAKYLKDVSRYNNIQMARKISLNSAYGAIGNEWFRYYDLRIAEGITTSGQLSIRWIERRINEYLNKILKTESVDYVLASDTDSVYITFDRLVSGAFANRNDLSEVQYTQKVVDFLDRVAAQKMEPFIDNSYQVLAETMNAYAQKMQMKREVIADKGIWTAKKRYILNAWDVEGVRYTEPSLKIMGIEAVKSSTPAPCREKIKQALKVIMSGTEKDVNNFIQEFRKEFMELPPEDIAFPRSVNGIGKWSSGASIFQSGTPMHVKGAILYNHFTKQNKLNNKYPLIQEGDKIKFLNMRTPNPMQSNVISFITKLPTELDIHKYLDYDKQFEKAFVEPLTFIMNQIGWEIDRSYGTQTTLEDFFC